MRAASLTGLAVFALAGTSALEASAGGDPVSLAWSAPAGCPAGTQVLGAIEQAVGAAPSPGHVAARVSVSKEGDTFVAAIELGDATAQSSRRVEADSCRAVADAVALIVALAVDPDAAPPAPEARPEPPRLARPGTRAQERPWFAAAAILADVSLLSTPAAGAELAVGWGARHVDAEIDGAALAPEAVTLADNPTQGAHVSLVQVGARACYELDADRFAAGPCAGASVAWLVARGFGSPPDRPAEASAILPMSAWGARATMRFDPRWALRATAEAVVPLERASVVIAGGGAVARMPVASFRGALGAEMHF